MRALGKLLLVMLAMAASTAAPAPDNWEEEVEDSQEVEKAPGTILSKLDGQWYIVEVWSNVTTIDFGENCIYFDIQTDPQNTDGICLTKTDVYKNGTRQRDPLCLVHDPATDSWVKPGGARKVSVLAAEGHYLVLDTPLPVDHWVLVLGERHLHDAYYEIDNADGDEGGFRIADVLVRELARRLGLGSPSSSVRLPNTYPSNNCDFIRQRSSLTECN